MKPIKTKSCRVCKKEYTPYSTTAKCCSLKCAMIYSKEQRRKEDRKANREAKQKLKTKSDHLREAQTIFNKYIRLRDKADPCISCGRYHAGQNHAGHYRSVGAAPELRFNEDNCHLQCAPCNNHRSGNAIDYRINLVKKIGVERVEFLEGKHEPKKYTIDDIIDIKSSYRQKIRG